MTMLIVPISLAVTYPLEAMALVKAGIAIVTASG
jgi:hypothetical protein